MQLAVTTLVRSVFVSTQSTSPKWTQTQATSCKKHTCNVPDCHNVQLHPNKFCEEHCCAECLRIGEPCTAPQKNGLCATHRCEAGNCTNPRAFERSTFCIQHTCRVCIEKDVTRANVTLSSVPRNTCRDHPLCEFVSEDGAVCSAEAAAVVSEKGTAMFCAKHSAGATEKRDGGDKKEDAIIDQCCGITSRNKRCKITKSDVGYNWFCSIHEKQRTHDDNRLVEAAEGDGTIIAEGCLSVAFYIICR